MALKLSPDQAQVLNFLGYSWVDQGQHLPEAFAMLEKARALSPYDGYIVDSVGWAYYRLGRYGDATKTLENAVLLVPGDSTINEHLGDAYWRVGRKLDAHFQWSHALPSDPTRTKSRSCKRNSKAAWNPVAIRPEQLRVSAPAKINLNLHVTRKRPDGYHDLQSLVAFADVGDVLMLEPECRAFARDRRAIRRRSCGEKDNLVLKAARALGGPAFDGRARSG